MEVNNTAEYTQKPKNAHLYMNRDDRTTSGPIGSKALQQAKAGDAAEQLVGDRRD